MDSLSFKYSGKNKRITGFPFFVHWSVEKLTQKSRIGRIILEPRSIHHVQLSNLLKRIYIYIYHLSKANDRKSRSKLPRISIIQTSRESFFSLFLLFKQILRNRKDRRAKVFTRLSVPWRSSSENSERIKNCGNRHGYTGVNDFTRSHD